MNKLKFQILFIFSFCLLLPTFANNALRVPTIIGDNMVLQRNSTAHLWGWSKPSSQIEVLVSWLNNPIKVKASQSGEWIADIPTHNASKKEEIIIKSDSEKITLKDIMIGEVWVCSGQSNMQFSVGKSIDVVESLKAPNENIRLYNTGRISSYIPLDDCPKASWTKCDVNSLKAFSAVGYAFGDKLQKELNVPVGLICASYGGTPIEGWTPEKDVTNNTLYMLGAEKMLNLPKNKKKHNRLAPGTLYNANISPIVNTTIAGVLWYQGCHNVSYSNSYYDQQLETLISTWRRNFKNPKLPFYIVQFVPHIYNGIDGAILREKQAITANKLERVEFISTIDQTDIIGDIHPRNKLVIGQRLANVALGENYGKSIEYRMPQLDYIKQEGNSVRVYFKNIGAGLVCKDNKVLGFQVADASNKYYLADAQIDGNTVIVSSSKVKSPTNVRYCFDEFKGNLKSVNSLPVSPFRTDSMNNILSARGYLEPISDISISVNGKGYKKKGLKENSELWENYDFQIKGLIEGLKGFQYLSPKWLKKGEETAKTKITAESDGRIYILVRNISFVLKLKWWTLITESNMNLWQPSKYRDRGKIYLAYKDMKAGETFTFEADDKNPSGFIPVAKQTNYK